MKLVSRFSVLVVLSMLLFHAHGQSKREFRAVWIATVKNIDWPSVPGLSTEEQKNEFRKLLDFHELNGMNAVIVQVRPSADAFYSSEYEPWSRYLTGESGLKPDLYYDPLTFMIDESHDRGLEFHAWFNPYRAVVDLEEMPEDSTNLFYEKPEWFLQYGDRMYFDPGIPEVQDYTVKVIKDVVKRYDVDAIHFDDYFYPYRIYGEEFPDTVSFENHGQAYTLETKDDWRRENVNTVIKMLNDTIKSVKPWVKFGISPFGVWRNKSVDPRGSDSEAGQTNYDDLFADVLKWMDEGWIDYVLPQLYLHIEHPKLSFSKVMKWWDELDYFGHLYVGHAIYRVGSPSEDEAWMNPSELHNQIRLSRQMQKVKGGAHFSSKSFFPNALGVTDTLRTDLYRHKALVPTMPWLDSTPPDAPQRLIAKNEPEGVYLSWQSEDTTSSYFVIYRFDGKKPGDYNDPANILSIQRANSPFHLDMTVRRRKKYTYAVSALDRLSNESTPISTQFIKASKK
ncbi:MAG: family 10 glycosylhydrolase [Cyclobacteriaceae bacterium]